MNPIPIATMAAGKSAEIAIDRVSKILDDRIIERRILRRTKNRTVETVVGLNGWHILGAGALILAGMAIGAVGWRDHEYAYYSNKTNRIEKGRIRLPCAMTGENAKYGIKIGLSPITGIIPIPVWTP